ncbi:type I polyketide synthase [Streptomyces sp. NPDC020480]|uniref:type I polyketide synthase n=1 Tax=Streptomyces sp. NPDC020480 TaxID=3365076 RepID=UPI0037AD5CA4
MAKDEAKLLDHLKWVTAELRDTRQRLREAESAEPEPIAIVGMACRFPGGVENPDDLWKLVAAGGEGLVDFPEDRGWDLENLFDPDPDRPGTSYARQGTFLRGAGGFDAEFFGISPREAVVMDPQQRVLLEVAWETFEHAGIDPHGLAGSSTGVYAGVTSQDYMVLTAMAANDVEGYAATGNLACVLSGRVSYELGLEGPAVTVDTGCSSSLVALHSAVQALRGGECSLALAGGVTVMATPGAFVEFSRQRGLAADGRCKSFAAAADGTGWGEGVGLLLLERLSDARRNGHKVWGVVRGSAINQDGASNGLTAPNGPSQQRVIRQALANARLSPADVDAVEAHGTGTTLGDPIEAQALLATYGQGRSAERPLLLGSVKSNIGHTQAAAGVAGIIKMVMAMRHGLLPKTLHVDEPTPHVDWSGGAVELLREATAWPDAERPRRAAVSSFGISGTNAHVILEEATAPAADVATTEPTVPGGVVPWVVSGRSAAALRAQAERLAEFAEQTFADPPEVGWSLAAGRAMLDHRAVVVSDDREELLAGLRALAVGAPFGGVVTAEPVAGGAGPVLVFPGQGGQWRGMGVELLDFSPVFAARIAECEAALSPFVDWSLTAVLRGEGGVDASRVDVVQPALWAVMVSLAEVWRSHGVAPAAVVGHSQGEIAAAVVAGALSLEDGARVVAVRSQALGVLSGRGAMASLAVGAGEAEEAIGGREGVVVAAVNGPGSTVISGPPGAVAEVVAAVESAGGRARLIDVDYASHGPQVDEIAEDLVALLGEITPVETATAFYSTVTGGRVESTVLDAAYWVENLRRQVRFGTAVEAVLGEGYRVLVEAGPHPVLSVGIQETAQACDIAVATVPTLQRDQGGPAQLARALAQAFAAGLPVDWKTWYGVTAAAPPVLDLPTYRFQHQHYWLKPGTWAGAEGKGSAEDERFWSAVESGDLAGLEASLRVGEDAARRVLAPALPVLAEWRRRTRDQARIDAWRYRTAWSAVTGPDAAPRLSGTWLLVVPEEWAGDAAVETVTQALEGHGAECVLLPLAPGDQARGPLAERLRQLEGRPEIAGVISALSLDEAVHPEHPHLPMGLAGTLALVQALDEVDFGGRLWCVTRGGVSAAGDGAVSPVQAQVWGLGRVVALEYPKRWGGLIDLPAVAEEGTAGRLAAVVAEGAEDQVALRAEGVLGRRLRAASAGAPGAEWRIDGSVVVTGGTGGVGGRVARWVVERGARHVILAGRRGSAAPGTEALTAELEALGASVDVVACDVADRDEVAALLARAPEEHPLRGVFHAAGVGDYTPVSDLDPDRVAQVAAAKAGGARWLDELTRDMDVSAFVLFSSGAASWGSGQQGAYAAANAYLDALAERRRAEGLPGLSVAWGPWGEVGMTAGDAVAAFFRERGLTAMAPELALRVLGDALGRGETALTVADFDWRRFAAAFAGQRVSRLLAEIPQAVELLEKETPSEDSPLRKQLAAAVPEQRHQMLTQHIRALAAGVLGHSGPDAISATKPFFEMGFDSLTAVELRNRLSASAGMPLPTTLIFDYPTADDLARYVLAEISGLQTAVTGTVTPVGESDEPIAIVGMACRFPGGVSSPEQLWDLVATGRDAMSPFPADRGWRLDTLYDLDPDRPGTSYVREGGFLHDAGGFDAEFFGISPREAVGMDPQQRLLLETAWETFERAGIDHGSLRGSDTGVYVGATLFDYLSIIGISSMDMEGYTGTGNLGCVLSGRVSYVLGLEGPAVTVDTGCSSSLVALHSAVQGLRGGECSLALAGGVTVMATPGAFVEFSRQRGLAADGRCKSFAAAADGTGWGEGVGLLLLERLSDARRNGHKVWGVVRGSAINQDGASNGLTAPNGPSQQRVIRQALANAGLSTADVDVVEAHGTGTTLGDPIEAQALLATYGQGRAAERPLLLGSVKSNIGHTQAAAGVAGIIKMVMAMRHGVVPKTLHVDEPTPHVDWGGGAVELLREATAWPEVERPRQAGVSAFGISGTNAHVIVEEAPKEPEAPTESGAVPVGGVVPWVVSGRSAAGLRAQAARLAEFAERTAADEAEVGWSLVAGRATLEHRAVVVGQDRKELLAGLTALAEGEPSGGVVTAEPVAGGAGPVLVFPGQGGQWRGMGVQLLDASPVFAARIAECEAALSPFVDWSLTAVLRGVDETADIDRVDVVQPALWAVMVSLAEVWRSHGVAPAAVVGHSQGEIAAAVVAGALSLEDGARVVAVRSQALRVLSGRGAMASLAVGAGEAEEAIGGREGVVVAAVNGPGSTVISGPPGAVAEVVAAVESAGGRARLVDVDYASHGPQVDEIAEELVASLGDVKPAGTGVAFYSTVTGGRVESTVLDAAYWVENLRRQVRFGTAVEAVLADGYRVLVEAGPHPVLSVGIQETAQTLDLPVATVPTLQRDQGGPTQLARALAQAFAAGLPVDWKTWYGVTAAAPPVLDLPTYPFRHQHYWIDPATIGGQGDPHSLGLTSADHPLLGAAVRVAESEEIVLTGRISTAGHPWVADHAVAGSVFLPGTAFVDLAVRAGDEAGCDRVEELVLETPLILPEEGALQLQLVVSAPGQDGGRAFTVHARAEGDDDADRPWTRHASGTLTTGARPDDFDFAQWPPTGAEPVPLDGLYAGLAEAGYGYGPAFRGLKAAWRRGDEVFAEAALAEELRGDAGRFGLHPALLDAALQAGGIGKGGALDGQLLLPFTWTGVSLYATGAAALRVRMVPGGDGVALSVADPSGRLVASAEAVVSRPVSMRQLRRGGAELDSLYRVEWVSTEYEPEPGVFAGRTWDVVGAGGLGIEDALERAGHTVRTTRDLAELARSVDDGTPLADLVVLDCAPLAGGGTEADPGLADAVHDETERLLGVVQRWLGDERFGDSRLALVTRGAQSTSGDERVADLVHAPLWGLVRSAQIESYDRLVLVDLEDGDQDAAGLLPRALAVALGAGEPQVAVRRGRLVVPRLARIGKDTALTPPDVPGWRLDTARPGTPGTPGTPIAPDQLALVPHPEAAGPLGEGQVRIAVRAAGLNPHDVVAGPDPLPDQQPMGGEGAGVVVETGPGVIGLAPGDRVMGVFPRAFGPLAVADQGSLVPVPAGWSYARAAAVPLAFLTAYCCLAEPAEVREGDVVLVHGAAGGVGMAAVQLARHLGAEVYATADESEWDALRALGLDDDHLASSRTLDFEDRVRAATGGRGVDVVLNSLAQEFTDASLRLLRDGGRFVEPGRTDVRDGAQLHEPATAHPGIGYRVFTGADPRRIRAILTEVVGLMERGVLRHLPLRTWDLRLAPDAFRYLSRARHTGKAVLTLPAPLDPEGTVLIVGGTGTIGGMLARHLVTTHGVRHLLVTGRRGAEAPGADALREELSALGAEVTIAACDAADRDALAALLADIPAEHPLTGVIHAAGVVDDGTVPSLTPEQLHTVLRPKVDAAVNLHQLIREDDLAAFVMFSSTGGPGGAAGQGNYAASNAFLDALAQDRRAAGLPGQSLAWGHWEQSSGITGTLGERDIARMERSGVRALSSDQGLALFDAAGRRPESLLMPARLDPEVLRDLAGAQVLPRVLSGLVRAAPARRATAAAQYAAGDAQPMAERLAGMSAAEQGRTLLELVRRNVAAVLGLGDVLAVDPARPFKEIGFDSLTAVELRNRLSQATDTKLPSTLVFDIPTPALLAEHLREQLVSEGLSGAEALVQELDRLEEHVDLLADDTERDTVTARLEALLTRCRQKPAAESNGVAERLQDASADEVLQFIDSHLGRA